MIHGIHKAEPMVRTYCAEHETHYTETSLLGSYPAAPRHLHALSAPLGARPQVALDHA